MPGLVKFRKEIEMSIKDRLAKKTQDLILPIKGETSVAIPNMRTGPGQMLMVNSLMKESNEKVAFLEARLRLLEGGIPTLLLDPGQIVASRWANRLNESLSGHEFEYLKSEIREAGGNIQPIKVRPLVDSENRYEIVFGHRRHHACLVLKLPVMAVVEELSDAELFKQMDRENRARADLSPWEQGSMYRTALNDKLFSSREHLARELNVDPGNLSKALRLADLHPSIVEAFPSASQLQYRWAKPLSDAFESERERVQTVLDALKKDGIGKSSRQIFDLLMGVSVTNNQKEKIRSGKKLVAEFVVNGASVSVRFVDGLITSSQLEALRDFISNKLF
jgi:ParB family chromosome partitioning protein